MLSNELCKRAKALLDLLLDRSTEVTTLDARSPILEPLREVIEILKGLRAIHIIMPEEIDDAAREIASDGSDELDILLRIVKELSKLSGLTLIANPSFDEARARFDLSG